MCLRFENGADEFVEGSKGITEEEQAQRVADMLNQRDGLRIGVNAWYAYHKIEIINVKPDPNKKKRLKLV